MKLALRLAVLLAVLVAAGLLLRRGDDRKAPALDSHRDVAAQTAKPADLEPVLAPAGTARESVASDSSLQQSREGQAADASFATLVVRAVSRESRTPLQGVSILAHLPDARRPDFMALTKGRASWGGGATSDVEGRVELEVVAAQELQLDCHGEYQLPPLVVPPLAAGERREIEVEFKLDDDLFLCGKLVDAETGLPVVEGSVWPENHGTRLPIDAESPTPRGTDGHRPEAEIHVPNDGRFRLQGRSWQDTFFSARAPGYARTVFSLDQGFESEAHPFEVRLTRSATLAVTVRDGALPVANTVVALSTSSHRLQQEQSLAHFFYTGEDQRWSASTDASGNAELLDLPCVPLQLTWTAPGQPARQAGETLRFEPGERRTLELRLDSGATIVGRIEDTAGRPIEGCELWRVAADQPEPTLLHDEGEPVAKARSDRAGRFRFEAVPVGTWHVGPAPHDAVDESFRPQDPGAIAPLAQVVTVAAGTAEVELVLRVDRGLYLEGTVVDPVDAPVGNDTVFAFGEDLGLLAGGRTDEAGRFLIGPLPQGSYALQANPTLEHAESDSRVASAGERGIVLRLRKGGAIHGRVVDAAGNPRQAEVTLVRDEGDSGLSMWSTPIDGTIRSGMLAPGRYTVSASTSDGSWGRSSVIAVGEGEIVEGIEVVLAPGARLRLRYEGQDAYGHFEVFVGGVAIHGDGIPRGGSYDIVVPSGEVEVRWFVPASRTFESQGATFNPGERRELVWKGKP